MSPNRCGHGWRTIGGASVQRMISIQQREQHIDIQQRAHQ
jgi:hypothetical protein